MSDIAFPTWAVYAMLENRLIVGEALTFPEISRLGLHRDRVQRSLRVNLQPLIERAPLASLFRRHLGGTPALSGVEIALEPPPGSVLWREPLPLHFPVLRWTHSTHLEIAYIPFLNVEVVAEDAERLLERLPVEVRAALSRGQLAATLPPLVRLQRAAQVKVEALSLQANIRGPKQRAQAAERDRDKTPSVLAKVATDLTTGAHEPTIGLEAVVEQLAELLTGRNPRSVLLVGPSGVGKTAAIRELAQRRMQHNLGQTPFWATSGARLVAGMSGFGMWQERCRKVIREASKKRAILHLGNLVELMEVGKSEHQTQGIAAFLQPSLARGELLAVAECTPEQVPVIEREDPHLLDVFHRLDVAEPDRDQGRIILEHAALTAPWDLRRTLTPDVLDVLDRLHRRYATYSAYPGRPLRFLRNLLTDTRKVRELQPEHVLTAFTRETGLPRVLLDPAMPLDFDRTRRWFAERVLGQEEATELVVNLLATTKAGLTRPRKPIASLLFIGPTGVGKTEMAKALAEFLFGSKQRLTRFDMSEFGDPISVQRLVGGVFGSEGLLTARVREQPFSVLLLDEFEKAHPQFLDLLLQMLGEGRLTDAAGRLADFSNAVVILTSNLGAASFQQGAFGFGARGEQREMARDHFVRAVQEAVRPELFNRIDRLVPFAPLGADTVRDIAVRHLSRLEGRDGIRYRGVTLTYGDGVAAHLARNGFDARYGARPLLRTVERELLAPLAEQMNQYSADLALAVEVAKGEAGLQVRVKARTDDTGRTVRAGTGAPLVDVAQQCVGLRRSVQQLQRCHAVRTFRNEQFQLDREQALYEKRQRGHAAWMARLADAPAEVRQRALARAPTMTAADQERMTRLARLKQVADRLNDLATRGALLEDEALQALYADVGAETLPAELFATTLQPLEAVWQELLVVFYSRQFPTPDRITLALFGEDRSIVFDLAAAYTEVAAKNGLQSEWLLYSLIGPAKPPTETTTDKEPPPDTAKPFWDKDVLIAPASGREPRREVLNREPVKDVAVFRSEPAPRVVGVVGQLRGPGAFPRFGPEVGQHVFRTARQPQGRTVLVDVSEAKLLQYVPPPGITRRGAVGVVDRRRSYDDVQRIIDDALLRRKVPYPNRSLAEALDKVLADHLQANLQAMIAE